MTVVQLSDIPCGPWVYHYTRPATAIDHILPSGKLRLSRLQSTNDRDETEPWQFDVRRAAGPPSKDVLRRYAATARSYFQYQVYLFSTIADESHELQSTSTGYGSRGFAMHSMWSHYGDGYAGVCLAFDHEALSRQFVAQVGPDATVFKDHVRYLGHVPNISRAIDIFNVQIIGFENCLRKHLEAHHQFLYYVKHTSWSYEREYRWIVHLNSSVYPHLYLRFGDALRALFIDDKCSAQDVAALEKHAQVYGVPLYKIEWSSMTLPVLRQVV